MQTTGVRARGRHLHRRAEPLILHDEGGAEEQLQGHGGARPPHKAGREATPGEGASERHAFLL